MSATGAYSGDVGDVIRHQRLGRYGAGIEGT